VSFIKGITRLKIKGSICPVCSHSVVPPRTICPKCGIGKTEMNRATFSNTGTIESFTTSRMTPDGFDDALLLALVRLTEGPLLLCSGQDSFSDKIDIGSNVMIEKNKDGLLTFRPT